MNRVIQRLAPAILGTLAMFAGTTQAQDVLIRGARVCTQTARGTLDLLFPRRGRQRVEEHQPADPPAAHQLAG